MSRSSIAFSLATIALGLGYFWLVGVVFVRLPYADLPTGWLNSWDTREIGVLVWFQLLSTVGAMAAAFPIALAISWRAHQTGARLSLAVAIVTTLLWLANAFYEFGAPHSWLAWGNILGTCAALLFAVPVVAQLARICISRISPAQGSGHAHA